MPDDTTGHVVICANGSIAPALVRRLAGEGIPSFVLEQDATTAADWYLDGVPVVTGELDDQATYEALRLPEARMLVANREDTVNTNIVLTIRAVEPNTPIVALAATEDSVDVLTLSGATHVLPLAAQLGRQLAGRVNAPDTHVYPVGRYHDLEIGELALRDTPLAGMTVRETNLREESGVSIVALRERGEPRAVRADHRLTDDAIAVVVGSSAQLRGLDRLLARYETNPHPVVVIGGGRVGSAAVHELAHRDTPVHVVERDTALCERLAAVCDQVFPGDAADYALLTEAGIHAAPSVLLTTADDAMNVYLASYCRRLNPQLRIVSRITHERNIAAIHRAGADFVLSYARLGTEAVMSLVEDTGLVVIGEVITLFSLPVPPALAGRSLGEAGIGARTGLTVIAQRVGGTVSTQIAASTRLVADAELIMLGDQPQREDFAREFGAGAERAKPRASTRW